MVIQGEIQKCGMPDRFELTGMGRSLAGNGGPIGGGFFEPGGRVTLTVAKGTSKREIRAAFRQAGWTMRRIKVLEERSGGRILARLTAKRVASAPQRDDFD